MKQKISLSIVIVTWNTAKITLKCVQSIKKHLHLNYEIIVVDNASTDNTVELLKKQKDIIIIKNKTNLGFGKANNIATKKAHGEYLLFLNSDMELVDDKLSTMLSYLNNHPEIGLIGPKFLNPDLTKQGSVFPPQTPLNAFKEFWLGKKSYSKYVPNTNQPIEVSSVSGGAILISHQLFNKIGGWDDRYFMYFEDLELCRQVKKLGYKIFFYPSCRLIHRHGASGKTLVDTSNQWRRLIPSSKIYHGILKHYLLFLITWSAQKWQKLSIKSILLFSLILRIFLLPWTYHGDVVVTYWWGKFASEFTWTGYYDWLNFGGYGRPDQPMLNIVYDWLIRLLYNFIYQILWFINIKIPIFPSNLMTWYFFHGNQILLKLPMIIADVLILFFVYRFIVKNISESKAKIAALIIALYPPLIYNSAIWGSGDSIINLLALLSIYFATQKKYIIFVILFIFSVLYKSSLLIWAPIIIIILLRQKIKILDTIKISITSIFLVYYLSLPFAIKNPLIWFYETMTQKILPGVMPQITANAMNFWAIFFGLQPRLDETLFLNIISFRTLSVLICIVLYLVSLVKLYKNYSTKAILLALTQTTLITFVFLTRMHERYTFPALIPLLILCFYDRKYIKYFIILSFTHLLNVYNWWWVPEIPFLINFLKLDLSIRIISFVNVILTLKLLTSSNKN